MARLRNDTAIRRFVGDLAPHMAREKHARPPDGLDLPAQANDDIASCSSMTRLAVALRLVTSFVITGCSEPTADETPPDPPLTLVPGNWVPSYGAPAEGAFPSDSNARHAVCRAARDDGWHPGKVFQGQCRYEWADYGFAATQFETLVNTGTYSWFRLTDSRCAPNGTCAPSVLPMPGNAIDGGAAGVSEHHTRFAVCQAFFRDHWHAGKFSNGLCHIEYNMAGEQLHPLTHDVHIAVSD